MQMDTQAELCETYQLKWSSHNTYMHSSIATALSAATNSFTDVALITTDGHQIMAHRFILSLSSQFLAQILKMQPKVTSALPLMIVMPPEINHKSLKVLVRYMYSGEAKVTKDILQSVLQGGDILQIKGLYREKEDIEKNVKITQQTQNIQPIQSISPTPNSAIQVAKIPSTTPVTIENSAINQQSKCTTNSTKSIPNTGTITTTKNTPNGAHTKLANNSKYRTIEPMPSTSGIPKEKLIQTTSTPQTFLVLKKPSELQGFKQRPQVLNFTITHTFDQNGQLNKEDAPIQRKAVVLNKPVIENGKQQKHEVVIKEEPKETTTTSSNSLQYLMIKDEPIDWNEDIDVINPKEVFEDITLKTEMDDNDSEEHSNNTEDTTKEELFSPLTCELCTETFTIPGEWVRHVQSHTDMLPAKRRRRDSAGDSYENDTFPELMCDLCQQPFSTPADWVKHIQSAHTEFELHLSNRKTTSKTVAKIPSSTIKSTMAATSVPPPAVTSSEDSDGNKQCNDCNKIFPSHASMVVHQRKHTGERPYGCDHCNKSFNVKSNLLRHLRTLHNKMLNSKEVDKEEDSSN